MEKKGIPILTFLVVMAGFFIGCQVNLSKSTPSLMPGKVDLPTLLATPTMIISPTIWVSPAITETSPSHTLIKNTPTQTPSGKNLPQPSQTITFTSSMKATVSPSFTATITPEVLNTLTIAEGELYIQRLLITNNDCKLPCFWGITPGKTPLELINQFFLHLGKPLVSFNGQYEPGFDLSQRISIRIPFHVNTGVIDTMHVGIGGEEYYTLVQYYSFKQVLSIYGAPSFIKLDLATVGETGETSTPGYHLWLFYDQYGFLVDYYGVGQNLGSEYRICPTNPFIGNRDEKDRGSVGLYLRSPVDPMPLEKLVAIYGGRIGGYSIDKAANLSVDEFYNQVLQNQAGPYCFISPRDIWP